MHRRHSLVVVSGLILGLGVCDEASADAASAPSVAVLAPQDIRYVEDAKVPGVGVAIVAGDPRTGHYTLRVRFAAGVKVPAHAHPDDRTVTVLSGTYYFGVGDRYDGRGLGARPRNGDRGSEGNRALRGGRRGRGGVAGDRSRTDGQHDPRDCAGTLAPRPMVESRCRQVCHVPPGPDSCLGCGRTRKHRRRASRVKV